MSGKSVKEFKKTYESQYSYKSLKKQQPKSKTEREATLLSQISECRSMLLILGKAKTREDLRFLKVEVAEKGDLEIKL